MNEQAQTIVKLLLGPAGPGAIQKLEGEIVPALEANPLTKPVWRDFRADPQNAAADLAAALGLLLRADAALAQRLDALLAELRQAAPGITAGGSVIEGNLTVGAGGKFAGHDIKEEIHTWINQPVSTNTFFQSDLYRKVEENPQLPAEDKADVKEDLQAVEQELAKGEQADEAFILRRLRNIRRMAPEILEVALATFASPPAGFAMIAAKIAKKMQEPATSG